jgi:DNA-binding MarR family transcriptional regulator
MERPFFYDLEYSAAFVANMASRLQDKISGDAQKVFKYEGLIIPVTDVSLMQYLNLYGEASIAEIANALGYSHQRVAIRIQSLEKLKLLERKIDPQDQRRKQVSMTPKAKQEMTIIEKIFNNTSTNIKAMFQEIESDLMEKLYEALCYLEQNPAVRAKI